MFNSRPGNWMSPLQASIRLNRSLRLLRGDRRVRARPRGADLALGLVLFSACGGEESVTEPPPPNRPPAAGSAIGAVTVAAGEAHTVEASTHFSDPDGDALSYSAVSSAPEVATAAVAGSAVTVTGVSGGSAEVRVTARDPGGLTASQSFGVTVPNRSPAAGSAIGAVTVAAGEFRTVEASEHFSDPDGDALTYSAVSSAPGVATAAVAGSAVTVAGVSGGSAAVTVTARDPGGLTASQTFAVTVPNRSPAAGSAIGAVTVAAGEAHTMEASGHFSDPDGDALTYSAVSSAPGVATAAAAGSAVTVTGVSGGTAAVTVTARDPGGLTASQTFAVTVPNRPPAAGSAIGAVTVAAGEARTVEASAHFSDPDGDALTYSAVSSAPGVATAAVSGSAVTVMGVSGGTAEVRVTARDPGGLTASQTFGVAVPNRSPAAGSAIGAVAVEAGEARTVEASAHFSDPDGDALTYSAVSSAPGVATVAVAGSAVTVTGVSGGTAAVTVTARDPGGLTASQTFAVTVPNRSPAAGSAIGAVTVAAGEAHTMEASGHFSDPDGDALTYSAVSSAPGVATAAAAGSAVTVTGVSGGMAAVTVTARDPGGLTASQTFAVTVPNRPPAAGSAIAAVTVEAGEARTVEASAHFSDPDGDALTYSAVSSAPGVATAAVSGSAVTVMGVSGGTAEVRVTARDPGGLTASQTFGVTVPNRSPAAGSAIGAVAVEAGEARTVEASAHFSDPDGDALTYSAVSSAPGVATVAVAGSAVTVTGVSGGTAAVTVTARDPGGLTASQTFAVTVPTPPPPPPPPPPPAEATYRVVFSATWSAATHPDRFPPGPHFSPLIGAVHNSTVAFWTLGGTASRGIESMAETGGTGTLAAEISARIPDGALAVISGSGTGSPGSATIGRFSVNADYPLVTLVTMIAPSPDWFAGVSGLSLLDEHGQWIEELTVTLYPLDAGSDSGSYYSAPDQDTSPKEAIGSLQGVAPFSSAPVGTFTFTRTNS